MAMTTFNEWVIMDPNDPSLRPVYDQPPCPGPTTHSWTLTIEEGRMGLGSGCSDCDIWIPYEDVWMEGLKVKVIPHVELHGYETPEYDFWIEVVQEG